MEKAEIINRIVTKCNNHGAFSVEHKNICYSAKFEFSEPNIPIMERDDIFELKAILLTKIGVKFEVYHYRQLFETTTIPYNHLSTETLIRFLKIVEPIASAPAPAGVIYEIVKVTDWTDSENEEYISTGRLFQNPNEAQMEADKLTKEETKTAREAFIVKQRTIK